jgi:hypothetical protein
MLILTKKEPATRDDVLAIRAALLGGREHARVILVSEAFGLWVKCNRTTIARVVEEAKREEGLRSEGEGAGQADQSDEAIARRILPDGTG